MQWPFIDSHLTWKEPAIKNPEKRADTRLATVPLTRNSPTK
jgi:hypothetical protein